MAKLHISSQSAIPPGSVLQNTVLTNGSSTFNWNNLSSLNNTINIGNVSLSGLLDDEPGVHVKKYQVLEIEEDLLVLSATWKRLRDEQRNGAPYYSISTILDKQLFDKITEEDRVKAAEVRDYYSKKIMLWKLKGQKLTKFREDMNSLIHSEGKVFKSEMCPLAYRLPEFHEYDVMFDALANEHSKIIKQPRLIKTDRTLQLQNTIYVGKRYTKRKEYWFTDDDDNLVTFSLTHDNPLLSLLDKCAATPLAMSGNFIKRTRDNVDYYVTEKFSFL